jgi:hypothetical protein
MIKIRILNLLIFRITSALLHLSDQHFQELIELLMIVHSKYKMSVKSSTPFKNIDSTRRLMESHKWLIPHILSGRGVEGRASLLVDLWRGTFKLYLYILKLTNVWIDTQVFGYYNIGTRHQHS